MTLSMPQLIVTFDRLGEALNKTDEQIASQFAQLRGAFGMPAQPSAPGGQLLADQLGGLLAGADVNPLVPRTVSNILDPSLGEQSRNLGMLLFGRYMLNIQLLQAQAATSQQVRSTLIPLAARLAGLARVGHNGTVSEGEFVELIEEIRQIAEELRGQDGNAA
ncbi:hypothetical protein IU421_30325 [Nocardia cyriacigeorgica]|uniref:hypothetical protein n=1 Tax=Nocardia cyriacigeorgica TaxID=135487 RepID=UPI0018944695|nr:hypothetical protein [Nocardia cyriacigeorgica]MBF6163052.1 hypothetical protein [Nocardia cyriacigeorgica]MBF6202020.1 hypothetical protein [Nocardia cyriacigeorgica]MBF6518544.1 hypothetical protein [Nocardia cyriacigeorgica]